MAALLHAMTDGTHRLLIVAQRRAGVRAGVFAQHFGRTFGDDPAAAVTAFGAEVNQPI